MLTVTWTIKGKENKQTFNLHDREQREICKSLLDALHDKGMDFQLVTQLDLTKN